MAPQGFDCTSAQKDFDPNPDVSGIGVLITFSASAYLTLILLFAYYFLVFDPSKDTLSLEPTSHPNPVDRIVLYYPRKWVNRISNASKEKMEKLVLVLSDQQLIGGLAMLVSGFLQLNSKISSYHWQMTIYLVWFSTFTHLATLTMLRRYMRDNPILRLFRLFFMTALIALLITALVPTASGAWLYWDVGDDGEDVVNTGMPALCFYTSEVLWLFIALLWGTLRLIGTRDSSLATENDLGFGQCLSIAMLSLFCMTVLQIYLGTYQIVLIQTSHAIGPDFVPERPQQPHVTSIKAIGISKCAAWMGSNAPTQLQQSNNSAVVNQPQHLGVETTLMASRTGDAEPLSGSEIPSLPRTSRTLSLEEGTLYSNQLRLSTTGSEGNRPLENLRQTYEEPPHKRDLYATLWYKGLVGFVFLQVIFLAIVILSGAISKTGSDSNVFVGDIRDINLLVLTLSLWITFFSPLFLLIYTLPFFVYEFASRPKGKWFYEFHRLFFQKHVSISVSAVASAIFVAGIVFLDMAIPMGFWLRGFPYEVTNAAYAVFVWIPLPLPLFLNSAYILLLLLLVSFCWFFVVRQKMRKERDEGH
ncbi:hypothetical protein DL98DRAFT_534304 [Cadophora sp. DSE1049]|nr:hypothetical protein DL98DRAFT_534304 [Cadophora sp. DSE1049]